MPFLSHSNKTLLAQLCISVSVVDVEVCVTKMGATSCVGGWSELCYTQVIHEPASWCVTFACNDESSRLKKNKGLLFAHSRLISPLENSLAPTSHRHTQRA